MLWFGDSVLYTTERHLMYFVASKNDNNGTICSFNCHQDSQPNIIANAITDRIVTSNLKKGKLDLLINIFL